VKKRYLVLAFACFALFFSFVDFWEKPSEPGEIVTVDGRQVHVFGAAPKSGNPPKATLIIDSGGGMISPYWFDLQRRIAKARDVQIYTYDRSGFGWSEPYDEAYDGVREVDCQRRSKTPPLAGANMYH
jgi:pimeloyl-ACP methyl ester carboxylesterase